MADLWIASLIVLWIIVLLMAFLLAGTLRQVGLIALRLGDDPGALITDSGLDRGVHAPDVDVIDLDDAAAKKLSEFPRVARVLSFITPSCLACRELAPHWNEVIATRHGEFDFITICRGDVEGCRRFRRMHQISGRMVADVSGRATAAYEVSVTPFVYLLDHEGHVLIRGVANNWTQLEALLDQEGTFQGGRGWEVVDVEAVSSQ